MDRVFRIGPVALLLVGWLGLPAHSQSVVAGPNAGKVREISLQSAYLEQPLDGARFIGLAGTLGADGGGGEISLDPNTCRLDEFGNPTGCTRRAVRRLPVRFQLLKPADPAQGQPLLYRIAAEGLDAEFFLVAPARKSGSYRLVARDRGATSRVVTLEQQTSQEKEMAPKPAEAAGRNRPGKARYYAQQVPGAVIITAEGEFPAAGYKALFRQSAIAVFPPEFSFVWVPPDGPSAQVITPFRASTWFKAVEPVESVTIHDAGGRQPVEVTPVPEPASGLE